MKKFLNVIKRHPIRSIVLVLLLMPLSWVATVQFMSTVVYNPESPLFSTSRFDFRNYRSEREFSDVLSTLFPVGTERAFVENIILKQKGASLGFKAGENGHYFIVYSYEHSDLPSYVESRHLNGGLRQAQFQYDRDGKVIGIKVHILDGKTTPRFFFGQSINAGEKP